MDTLTHIVLGACIGEAIAGKQLGKKALFLGALAQNIPDFDFLASFWLPTASDVLAHRGFTHSLLFLVLCAPLLAWLSVRISRSRGMGMLQWALFWGLQVFIHIFIDAFNAYGTGWFEPFSHYRVSFNTLFVADPLFSAWPGVAMAALLVIKTTNKYRITIAKAGLGLSIFYLVLSIAFKLSIDSTVERDLHNKGVAAKGYFTTPTPLNNMLWYVVAAGDSGYYTGYRSVFDKQPGIAFRYVYRNDSLLKTAINRDDVNKLMRFSRGYYTLQQWHDTLVFNDMLFGEQLGWARPDPKFVFYYYLQPPSDNKLIVQRGRFAGWNKAEIQTFLKRIKGI